MNIWESNEDLDFETIGVDMDHVNKEATKVEIFKIEYYKIVFNSNYSNNCQSYYTWNKRDCMGVVVFKTKCE
jgi:hypothetical protein